MPSGATTLSYSDLASARRIDRARRIDLHRIAALERGQAGGFERIERERQRKWMTLGDEGGKAAAQS